jgi:hypothetical protein
MKKVEKLHKKKTFEKEFFAVEKRNNKYIYKKKNAREILVVQ